MQIMESLQMVKEQLKVKTIELRKIHEEKGRIDKKIKDLMTFNQGEVKKLKKVISEKDEVIKEKEVEVQSARMSKNAAFEQEKIKAALKAEKLGIAIESDEEKVVKDSDSELLETIDQLTQRTKLLRERIDLEKKNNKRFQKEKGVLLKELKRLRQDTNSIDNLKERIEAMKKELKKAKTTSMTSSGVTDEIVQEKDALLKKYEDMLYGNVEAGEEGMLPAEIIQELKEDVQSLEKERKDLLVELEMLKEDNAEIEMKLNLAEMEKGKGEGDHRQAQDGRSAATAEFSAGLENFLITYADMITLLLVIFVLMYSVSKLDENRFAEAMSSFQEKRMRIESVNVRLNKKEMKMLERVREMVKDNIDPELLKRGDTRTILKRLSSSELFAPGDSLLKDGAEQLIIDTIGEDMQEGVKQVMIDGHTDNVPMKSFKFPSNWELSSARAAQVGHILISKMRFPPERLVVAGYGEFRPLKPNTNDDNRAMNRRVEIKILKDHKVAEEEDRKRRAGVGSTNVLKGDETPPPAGTSPKPTQAPGAPATQTAPPNKGG